MMTEEPRRYFSSKMKCPKRTTELPALLPSNEEEEEESESEVEGEVTLSQQEIRNKIMESLRTIESTSKRLKERPAERLKTEANKVHGLANWPDLVPTPGLPCS